MLLFGFFFAGGVDAAVLEAFAVDFFGGAAFFASFFPVGFAAETFFAGDLAVVVAFFAAGFAFVAVFFAAGFVFAAAAGFLAAGAFLEGGFLPVVFGFSDAFFGAALAGLEVSLPFARVVFFVVAMARIILKRALVVKGKGKLYSFSMASQDQQGKVRRLLSLVAFPLFIIATLTVVWIYRHDLWNLFKSSEQIEKWLEQTGVLAPLGFIALQFVQVVIFVIPGEVPQIAGGYLFGMWLGTLYSITGIVLGSAFNFYLARLLGVPFVQNLFGKKQLKRFDNIVHSPRAQTAFFLLFVIPGIPKDILCYVAGLSPIRFWVFLTISAIGRLPGIIGSAGMGDAAASRKWVLAGTILVLATVLFILGLIFREKLHTLVERFTARGGADEKESDSESES